MLDHTPPATMPANAAATAADSDLHTIIDQATVDAAEWLALCQRHPRLLTIAEGIARVGRSTYTIPPARPEIWAPWLAKLGLTSAERRSANRYLLRVWAVAAGELAR